MHERDLIVAFISVRNLLTPRTMRLLGLIQMTLHDEMLLQLDRYFAGESSIGEFEDWFFPATWNVHKSGDAEAVRLRGPIALRLSELDRGHWTEAELRQGLCRIRFDDPTYDPVPQPMHPSGRD